MSKIEKITVRKLWDKRSFSWDHIFQDVNVLVGINGCGKTTIIQLIYALLQKNVSSLKKFGECLFMELLIDGKSIVYDQKKIVDNGMTNILVDMVSTFDVGNKDYRRKVSPLQEALDDVLTGAGKGNRTFNDYRLKATNFPDQADHINKRISDLFVLINSLFFSTSKIARIDLLTNKIVFDVNGDSIGTEQLSSGEKQLLLILFKIFLTEEDPFVFLMDEPEISLHIGWQYELINIIRKLNPNCQLIISTHSPSIFGDGWGDKITYVEDIIKA